MNAFESIDGDKFGVQGALAAQVILRPEVLFMELKKGNRKGLQLGVLSTKQCRDRIATGPWCIRTRTHPTPNTATRTSTFNRGKALGTRKPS